VPPPSPPCAGAHVLGAHTDERGQTATIAVDTPADCPLVVAANYIATMRATAIVDGRPHEARVFPIDIALTGIAVPARATSIILEPVATVPAWSIAAAVFGWLLLAAALALALRSPALDGRALPDEPHVAPIRPRAWIARLRRDRGLQLLVCALVAAAVIYLPTLGRGIVNYDDPWLVRDNYQLRDPSWSSVHAMFFDLDTDSPRRYALGAEYLPVRDLSVMADYAVWGDNYAGFHLTSLLVYLAAIALAFGMLVEFGIDRTVAGVAVLVWALHPSHAESVAWLSERKGLLAAALACAAGYGYAKFRAGGATRWIVLGALAAVAAVWSKAPAAFALAALAALEVVLPARRVSWRRSLAGLGALGVAAIAFVPVIATALGATIVGTDSTAPAGRAATVLGVHGLYVELALMALRNAISYSVDSASPSVVQIVLGSVALLACIAALARKRTAPEYRAAAALWIFGWLPVSHLILPIHTVVAADRYLLFATLGFGLAIAVALQRIPSRRVRIAVGAAFVTIALIRAFDAQSQWGSSLERAAALPVMRHAAEGGEPRAMANYALLELEDKHVDSALAWARKASAAGPGMVHTRRTHGKVALDANLPDEALGEFRIAYEIEPACTNRYNLALALAQLHRTAEALPHLDACALDPALGPASRDLAAHLRAAGDMR
jgi:protein O-mannosyl-transferase